MYKEEDSAKRKKGKARKNSGRPFKKAKLSERTLKGETENYIAQAMASATPQKALERLQEKNKQLSERNKGKRITRHLSEESRPVQAAIKKLQDKQQKMKKKIGDSESADTGMTASHNIKFARFSVDNDIITMWRPVNEAAADKLAHGYIGKALNLKAKSSTFDPIAADIPANVRLSKIAFADAETIAKFQKANADLLKKHKIEYEKISRPISKENIESLNNLLLVTEIPKKDEQGRELFVLIGEDGEILTNSDKQPAFLVKEGTDYYWYDFGEKTFLPEPKPIPQGYSLSKVNILGYRQFFYKENEVKEEVRPITADYDELVSAARKIFPYGNNEEIKVTLPRNLFKRTAEGKASGDALWVEAILNYELKAKQTHREANDIGRQLNMGNLNDMQLAAKVHLKAESEAATNHGPEVNNPYPEKLSDDKYPVFLPNGEIEILKSEEEICDFINRYRKKGFPLDVNPKWGWDIDDKGNLFIPVVRFDWSEVDHGMRILAAEIASLEELLNDPGLSQESKEENKEKLKYSQSRYSDEENIIKVKLAIESFRLEPAIVYSEYVDNWGRTYKDLLGDDGEDLYSKISDPISQKEKEWRQQKIEELIKQLNDLKEEFGRKYKAELSYIEKAEHELAVTAPETKMIGASKVIEKRSKNQKTYAAYGKTFFSPSSPKSGRFPEPEIWEGNFNNHKIWVTLNKNEEAVFIKAKDKRALEGFIEKLTSGGSIISGQAEDIITSEDTMGYSVKINPRGQQTAEMVLDIIKGQGEEEKSFSPDSP